MSHFCKPNCNNLEHFPEVESAILELEYFPRARHPIDVDEAAKSMAEYALKLEKELDRQRKATTAIIVEVVDLSK